MRRSRPEQTWGSGRASARSRAGAPRQTGRTAPGRGPAPPRGCGSSQRARSAAGCWRRGAGDLLVPLLVHVTAEFRAEAEVIERLGDIAKLSLDVRRHVLDVEAGIAV